jgi:hypothetical protein
VGGGAGAGSGGGAAGGGGAANRGGGIIGAGGALTDDVKLLLLHSNMGYVRTKLMPGLTSRYLLVLAGACWGWGGGHLGAAACCPCLLLPRQHHC